MTDHPQGVIDLNHHSTEPGSPSVFAPPVGFTCSDTEYVKLMRRRYAFSIGAKQQMYLVSLLFNSSRNTVVFSGPFATRAKEIVSKIASKRPVKSY